MNRGPLPGSVGARSRGRDVVDIALPSDQLSVAPWTGEEKKHGRGVEYVAVESQSRCEFATLAIMPQSNKSKFSQ